MCPSIRLIQFTAVFVLASCARTPQPVDPIVASEPVERNGEIIEVDSKDWPWWRGPSADGISRDEQAAIRWSQTKNVVWKTPVPGKGHSSPILWRDRIFITTADEEKEEQLVLAFDRKTGKSLWSTVAYRGGFMRKHGKNTHASATPVCDGDRVYSAFISSDALRVTATDLDGKILWQNDAGPFASEHGYGSSPVLYKSLVIVLGDNLSGSFIAALDRETGKVVWRTPRRTTGRHGSYATPVIAELAGRQQLLVTGMNETASYEPETGKLIWSAKGPTEVTACTIAVHGDLVFATGGYPDKEILAIRADGTGDVSESHVVWRTNKGVTYVPSPLAYAGRLYIINDGGIATCFEAETGKQIWQERLKGNFSASPILAGGHLYITNEAGTTYVLKEGTEFKLVAENDLGDGGFATLAICGGRTFIRTDHHLYCIAEKQNASAR